MKDEKNDMNNIGIRSDRIMTPLEVQRAAMNYKAVKQAAEDTSRPDMVVWILLGICMLVILYGVVCAL